jgi:hypothetical protein
MMVEVNAVRMSSSEVQAVKIVRSLSELHNEPHDRQKMESIIQKVEELLAKVETKERVFICEQIIVEGVLDGTRNLQKGLSLASTDMLIARMVNLLEHKLHDYEALAHFGFDTLRKIDVAYPGLYMKCLSDFYIMNEKKRHGSNGLNESQTRLIDHSIARHANVTRRPPGAISYELAKEIAIHVLDGAHLDTWEMATVNSNWVEALKYTVQRCGKDKKDLALLVIAHVISDFGFGPAKDRETLSDIYNGFYSGNPVQDYYTRKIVIVLEDARGNRGAVPLLRAN